MMLSCILVASLQIYNACDIGHIQKNNKLIDLKTAQEVSKSLRKYANIYKLPYDVMSAIAATESQYDVGAVNKKSDDFGIYQINQYNIDALKLDKQKLLTNIDYSVEAGFKVFSWFYKTYPLDEAIMRYNCGVRKECIKWKSVKHYLKKVKNNL